MKSFSGGGAEIIRNIPLEIAQSMEYTMIQCVVNGEVRPFCTINEKHDG